MNPSQKYDRKQFLQPTVNAITEMLDLPVSIWLVNGHEKVLQAAAVTEILEKVISKGRTIHYLPPYRPEHDSTIKSNLGFNTTETEAHISQQLIKAIVKQRSIKI